MPLTGRSTAAFGDPAHADPEQSVLTATRALLWLSSAEEARDVAVALVHDLGGRTVRGDEDDEAAVPIDISFGAGPVLLPAAERASVSRMLLERHLPLFVEDAHRALALATQAERLAEDASVDPLTGLANRRATGRVLGRLHDGDAVALVDLDHFKRLNDTLGHDAGDRVLRAFGHLLRTQLRARDHAGRRGGEEFLILMPDTDAAAATALLDRLRHTWDATKPHAVTFSAGLALVGSGGDPVIAADRALYRAKHAGRGRTEVACDEEYE